MENHKTGIVPTCREVHQLTSEAMDRKLTLIERARMWLHRLVCGPCRAFGDQMLLLRKAMHRMAHGEHPDGDHESK